MTPAQEHYAAWQQEQQRHCDSIREQIELKETELAELRREHTKESRAQYPGMWRL